MGTEETATRRLNLAQSLSDGIPFGNVRSNAVYPGKITPDVYRRTGTAQ